MIYEESLFLKFLRGYKVERPVVLISTKTQKVLLNMLRHKIMFEQHYLNDLQKKIYFS